MNFIDKTAMYITSMFPVGIVVGCTYLYEMYYEKCTELTYSFSIVTGITISLVISFFWLFVRYLYIRYVKSKKSNGTQGAYKIYIENTEKEKSAVIDYMLSFVLPLLAFDNEIAIIVYAIIIGFLYIKYGLVKYNFMLEILHFTLYQTKYNNKTIYIYSHKSLLYNMECKVVFISEDVAILLEIVNN